ncbi:hypothetical protein [Streptomyces sp. MP131-18]|uniref:hypothetical protein n=1 Tax=Streptomyces sp. MP131-18 TaxID=1857892 RepID=UPI0009A184C3|nr:hypothetical protein [Streptomyces sp. MP131-18]ONK14816.1 hypothetical protein STBA_56080 [Streptomyces sp. MP131-18]
MTSLFDERRRLPRALDVLQSLFLAACVAGVPFLWPRTDDVVARVMIAVCLGVVPALILAFHSRVTVDARSVRLSLFPVWRKTIRRSDIAGSRPRQIGARDLHGLGLRPTTDGALGLVMRGRDAVEIELKNGKRYVIGTGHPAALHHALSPTHDARDAPSSI